MQKHPLAGRKGRVKGRRKSGVEGGEKPYVV